MNSSASILILLFLANLMLPPASPAAEGTSPQPPYTIPRIEGPVRVDGLLDEPAWDKALSIPIAYEVDPGNNTPAPVPTEALLAYDGENLYLGFRAHDPDPAQIRAHLTDRDQSDRDDFVGIMMDTFNDGRRGYEFFSNPLGVQMDLARNDLSTDNQEDATWDGIWKSGGRIIGQGYTVEMAIPFATLRFPRTDGEQTWGIFLFRNYPRSVRHQLSSAPLDQNRSCFFCQLEKLGGFIHISPGRSIELDPTVTAHRTDLRPEGKPGAPLVKGSVQRDLGLSGRWGITPNLSLNGALNPDFSQVEADAPQLGVNTRFALFYSEKRPLFLEGADLFGSPLQAVYTRTVADPSWGLKLSGKEGGSALGAFTARDQRTNFLFPSNQGSRLASLDGPVTSAVLRYRRDVAQGSTVGLLATDREGSGYFNRLYGADSHLQLGASNLLNAQLLGTSTRYDQALARDNGQPLRRFDAFGGNVNFIHDTRYWSGWLAGELLEPGFRADLGFIPRVDTRTANAGITHHFRGSDRQWFTRIDLNVEGTWTGDHTGRLTDSKLYLEALYQGPRQSRIETWVARTGEFFAGRTYDQNTGKISLQGDVNGALKLWGAVGGGQAIDYENARPAHRFFGGPGFNADLGRHLHFYADHTYEQLTTGGTRIYRANLIASRVVYQFGLRTFLRAIVNYTDLRRYPGASGRPAAPQSRELFAQFLYSFKVNPQTVLYLGYSGTHQGPAIRELRPIDPTVFLKIGYAWLI
jgi:hypothetical protein